MGMSNRAMQMYNRSLECDDCPEMEGDDMEVSD
jgi:hypothetical protein